MRTIMNFLCLNDDVWHEIFLYFDIKSIFNLELTNTYFQQVLQRLHFWEKKIRKEFPHYAFEIFVCDKKKKYFITKKIYWDLYCQNHKCNICKLCFIDEICSNIPNCTKCDWLDYIF